MSSLRLSAALAGIAAAVALVPGTAAAATPAPTTSNPASAAAGWLVQQFSNAHNQRGPAGDHIELSFDAGSGPVFYYDGGGTIDAALALAATHSGKQKIDTATDYVAAHLDAYVDYSKTQGGPFYGSVGKAALLAIVDGRDPNNFGGHHLLSELKADECPTGATSCLPGDNTNIFSSVSTALIVIAEQRAGGSFAPSANLIHLLLNQQCSDGGFSSDIPPASTCKSDPDVTGYAVMALQALGGHSTQIAAAATYLDDTRRADGSWADNGGPNIDSTGLAAAALSIAGESPTKSQQWLADQQVTTGPTAGTGSQRGALKYQGKYDPNSSIKGTSDGIFGLVPHTSLATLSAAGATPGTAVLALDSPSLTHTTVHPGGAEAVSGTGFGAGEKVQAAVHSTPIGVGSGTADKNGTVHISFTVPASLTGGAHTVVLTGESTGLTSKTTFHVLAAGTPTTTSAAHRRAPRRCWRRPVLRPVRAPCSVSVASWSVRPRSCSDAAGGHTTDEATRSGRGGGADRRHAAAGPIGQRRRDARRAGGSVRQRQRRHGVRQVRRVGTGGAAA